MSELRRRMMGVNPIKGIRRNSSASGVATLTTDVYITRDDAFTVFVKSKQPIVNERNIFVLITGDYVSAYLEIRASGYYGDYSSNYYPMILNDGNVHNIKWSHGSGSERFSLSIDNGSQSIIGGWVNNKSGYLKFRFIYTGSEMCNFALLLGNELYEFEPIIYNGQITLRNKKTNYICQVTNGDYLEAII